MALTTTAQRPSERGLLERIEASPAWIYPAGGIGAFLLLGLLTTLGLLPSSWLDLVRAHASLLFR